MESVPIQLGGHHSEKVWVHFMGMCVCGFSKLVQVCLFSGVWISSRSVFKHQAIEGLLFLEFIFLFNPLIRSGEMSRLSTQHKRKPQWSSKEKVQNNRQITRGYIVQLLLSLKCAKLEIGEEVCDIPVEHTVTVITSPRSPELPIIPQPPFFSFRLISCLRLFHTHDSEASLVACWLIKSKIHLLMK